MAAAAMRLGAGAAPPGPLPSPSARAAALARDEAYAHKACGSCHAFPPPDILPREFWQPKVQEMAALAVAGVGAPARAEGLFDFDPGRVSRFYEDRAPGSLPAPEPWPEPTAGRFARRALRLPGGPALPAIANVRFVDLEGDGRLEVLAVDMNHGLVLSGSPWDPSAGLRVLARAPTPCRVEPVDLDRDGTLDLLVADLGAVPPADHSRGSVIWMRRERGGGWQSHTIAGGLPRVADVRAADFDGDSDLDLVVAAFGWRTTGSVLLLENRTIDYARPVFVARTLDARPGAIHVPPVDLDGDGRTDFLALLAQHYETVIAFLNDGSGGFRQKTLYTAPHPNWGSSGIDLADLDGDGDLDVLLAHGDMLDDRLIKPYHGIQWLENLGGLTFEERTLATLAGVHAAKAADLDGDGDLDVVAAAFVETEQTGPRRTNLPSLVWMEQVARGRFERRTLEVGGHHVTVDAADFDRDGDTDLVVGSFRVPSEALIEVWENQAPRP